MPNFDDILNTLYSDVKVVTKEVGKRAERTVAISKLNVERTKIKNRIQQNYRRLGEIAYGGYKNEENVSDIVAVLFSQLDDDFERIEDIYNELCALKNGVDVCMEPEWDDDPDETEDAAKTEKADAEPVLLEEKPQEAAKSAEEALEDIAEAAEEAFDAIEDAAEEAVEKRKQSLKNNFSGIDVDAD